MTVITSSIVLSQAVPDEVRTVKMVLAFCMPRLKLKPALISLLSLKVSSKVAYITIEANDLLRTCFAELEKLSTYSEQSELMLRGTLPKSVLEKIEKNTILLDPKGLGDRFTARKRIYIESWSELVVLASLTCFYEAQKNAPHYICCIGIETAYKDSQSREKFLGDGAIASRDTNGRQILQSCLAQNIKGKPARLALEEEVIARLQDKLLKAPDEPSRILAVTIFSENTGYDDIDFTKIAAGVKDAYDTQSTYSKLFCIVPGFSLEGSPQVAIIPLWLWNPGSTPITALVDSNGGVEFLTPED